MSSENVVASEEKEKYFAKCRRGSDSATSGQSCNSLSVYKESEPGSSHVRFRCCSCNHVWVVSVGGHVNL